MALSFGVKPSLRARRDTKKSVHRLLVTQSSKSIFTNSYLSRMLIMLHNGDGRGWKRVAGVGEKLLRVLHVIIHRMQQHFAGTDESLHQVRLHRRQNEHVAGGGRGGRGSIFGRLLLDQQGHLRRLQLLLRTRVAVLHVHLLGLRAAARFRNRAIGAEAPTLAHGNRRRATAG